MLWIIQFCRISNEILDFYSFPPFFGTNCQKKGCHSILSIHAVSFTVASPIDRNDIVWCCLRIGNFLVSCSGICLFLVSSCSQHTSHSDNFTSLRVICHMSFFLNFFFFKWSEFGGVEKCDWLFPSSNPRAMIGHCVSWRKGKSGQFVSSQSISLSSVEKKNITHMTLIV